MNQIKTVKGQHLKTLITEAADKHAAIHGGISHHAMNSHERRLARHEEMESNLLLSKSLGKGGS
jgi:hypothetical protein